MNNELIWVGFAYLTREQNETLSRIIAGRAPAWKQDRGPYRIDCYFLDHCTPSVISANEYRIGFGLLCTEEHAKDILPSAKSLLADLGIFGTPTVWKLYASLTQVL